MSEAAHESKGALRAALRHRQFRSLISAYAISFTGDFVYVIALVAYVFERTGSAGWVAAAGTVRIIPFVLFGPIGGLIAARYDRRRVMIASDLIRGGVMMAMALATAVDAPAAIVIAMAFVNNTATAPWGPAAAASTPAVVGEDDLAAANAVEATISQLSMFIGPAIGAVLFAFTSAPLSFIVNGVSFGLSAVLISRVTSASQVRTPAATPDSTKDDQASGWLAEVGAGWRATRRTPGVLLLQGLFMVVLFAYGFEVVLHALVAAERLGIGAEGAGYVLGAVGVGGLVIAPLSGRVAAARQSGAMLAVATVLLGAPCTARGRRLRARRLCAPARGGRGKHRVRGLGHHLPPATRPRRRPRSSVRHAGLPRRRRDDCRITRESDPRGDHRAEWRVGRRRRVRDGVRRSRRAADGATWQAIGGRGCSPPADRRRPRAACSGASPDRSSSKP